MTTPSSPSAERAPILVLGLGNILLSDEGVGVKAAEALACRHALPPSVEVVDGGTTGMDMLDLIANRRHLLVLDAVSAGHPPGTLLRLAGDAVPAFFRARISPHQLGLGDLLASLRLLGEEPGEVVILGCQPESLELGLDLSPTVAGKFDALVAMAAEELARMMQREKVLE